MFDVGKMHSPQQFPLKPETISKKQRATKVHIRLQEKVNKLFENFYHKVQI